MPKVILQLIQLVAWCSKPLPFPTVRLTNFLVSCTLYYLQVMSNYQQGVVLQPPCTMYDFISDSELLFIHTHHLFIKFILPFHYFLKYMTALMSFFWCTFFGSHRWPCSQQPLLNKVSYLCLDFCSCHDAVPTNIFPVCCLLSLFLLILSASTTNWYI